MFIVHVHEYDVQHLHVANLIKGHGFGGFIGVSHETARVRILVCFWLSYKLTLVTGLDRGSSGQYFTRLSIVNVSTPLRQ